MSVTGITQVINYSGLTLQLRNLENGDDNVTVLPGDNAASIDIWVDWARSSEEYASHHLIVRMGNAPEVTFYIWQEGNSLRYSTDNKWQSNGQVVPGDSEVGKSKTMCVYNNLALKFKNA